jgi:hypothetical protein
MSFLIDRIKISTSELTNTIYIGRVNAKETLWLEKRDCTDEALCAVRDHLAGLIPEGKKTFGYEWDRKDGKIVELRVSVRDDV